MKKIVDLPYKLFLLAPIFNGTLFGFIYFYIGKYLEFQTDTLFMSVGMEYVAIPFFYLTLLIGYKHMTRKETKSRIKYLLLIQIQPIVAVAIGFIVGVYFFATKPIKQKEEDSENENE